MIDPLPLFVPAGGPEILIVLVLAILLFGASRIPKISRAMGESIGAFKKGQEISEQELEELRNQSSNTSTDDDTDSSSREQ